ncbi:hypothetical protein [Calothrix sp. PCC 7507]|uniref:hypothetical protein n=1 Tax=Calothrix sp. PCC 7507 TaxID=99598 RepID=UPI00029F0F5D|nr:hypothetical protein Cal7507_2093 [Calothrix sp. PCC 7507]
MSNKNRKRSKRRAIFCPVHGCYLHSVSQKYQLFADSAEQLQKRGVGRRNALMLVAAKTAISIRGEWLEAFWCDQCEQTKWYHVKKCLIKASPQEACTYEVSEAPPEYWQQASGVIDPQGNPSVGEFTRRHARILGDHGGKDFHLRN